MGVVPLVGDGVMVNDLVGRGLVGVTLPGGIRVEVRTGRLVLCGVGVTLPGGVFVARKVNVGLAGTIDLVG